jgi:hypothetical protein
MASRPLISWSAPTHSYTNKGSDWYWVVGIITFAITAVCIIFGQIITGLFVMVAAIALVLRASQPPQIVRCEINDRGVLFDKTLYPFVTLESFWIPHDDADPRLLLKSLKTFAPLFVIHIEGVDPDDVREVLLKYIAETEHREPFLTHLIEAAGF